MPVIAQFDFPFQGPFGDDAVVALGDLARSIVDEPGFRWKVWTEGSAAGEAGGIYLFDDEAAARAYVDKHTGRLAEFGITEIRAKIFDVNEGLTNITRGPID